MVLSSASRQAGSNAVANPRVDSFIAVLHWNCRGLRAKEPEDALRLRQKPIPVLALNEEALPDMKKSLGHVKCVAPFLPTFFTVARPYTSRTSSPVQRGHILANGWRIRGRGWENTIRQKTVNGGKPIRTFRNKDNFGDVHEGFRSLCGGSLLICDDMNAHHVAWGSVSSSKCGRCIADEVEAPVF